MATRINHYSEQSKSAEYGRRIPAAKVDTLGRQAPIEFPASRSGRSVFVTPYGRVHEVNRGKVSWRSVVGAVGVAAVIATAALTHSDKAPTSDGIHDPAMDKMTQQQIDEAARMAQERGEIPSSGQNGIVEAQSPQLPDGSLDSPHN